MDPMEPALLRHLEPTLSTPHPRDVPPSHQGTARQEKGARNPSEDPSSSPSAGFRCGSCHSASAHAVIRAYSYIHMSVCWC